MKASLLSLTLGKMRAFENKVLDGIVKGRNGAVCKDDTFRQTQFRAEQVDVGVVLPTQPPQPAPTRTNVSVFFAPSSSSAAATVAAEAAATSREPNRLQPPVSSVHVPFLPTVCYR